MFVQFTPSINESVVERLSFLALVIWICQVDDYHKSNKPVELYRSRYAIKRPQLLVNFIYIIIYTYFM